MAFNLYMGVRFKYSSDSCSSWNNFFKTKSWKTSVVLGIVVGAFLITPVYHSHHEHVDNVRMEKEFNDVN